MAPDLNRIAEEESATSGSHPEFRVLYERGHDLSGTVRFEARGDGAFSLQSNVTAGRRPGHWSGRLSPLQHSGLFGAVARARLPDIPDSTRHIGDDEEPVALTLESGSLVHRLVLWNDDAARSESFRAFETVLLGLVADLSGGAVLAMPG